jgi:hypothetical protein
MAFVMFALVWTAVWDSLLPKLIVGVEAYDSLGLQLDARKPLEIDPHPPFEVHLKGVHSLQKVHGTGFRLQ